MKQLADYKTIMLMLLLAGVFFNTGLTLASFMINGGRGANTKESSSGGEGEVADSQNKGIGSFKADDGADYSKLLGLDSKNDVVTQTQEDVSVDTQEALVKETNQSRYIQPIVKGNRFSNYPKLKENKRKAMGLSTKNKVLVAPLSKDEEVFPGVIVRLNSYKK